MEQVCAPYHVRACLVVAAVVDIVGGEGHRSLLEEHRMAGVEELEEGAVALGMAAMDWICQRNPPVRG